MPNRCIQLTILLAGASWCWAKPLPPGKVTIQGGILDELKQVPRPGPFAFQDAALDALPVFADKELLRYQADYLSWTELKKQLAKAPDKQPLRWATLKAVDGLQAAHKLGVQEKWKADSATAAGKGRVLEEQKRLALVAFELEEQLRDIEAAAAERGQEKSPRWQAHFDYVRMAYLARLVFLFEYNYTLGDIRAERLPALTPGAPGWRIISGKNLHITEGKVRAWSRQIDQLLDKLIEDHADTPWSLLARREKLSPRGLAWQSGW